jgi:hypothetical protein
MELVRSSLSIVSGLPCEKVRSAPAIVVSGPAQRSLSLWPARSPSRLATLYIESSDSFVASAAVSIVTGWNEPVPGRELHPLKSSAFHGALFRQLVDGLKAVPFKTELIRPSLSSRHLLSHQRIDLLEDFVFREVCGVDKDGIVGWDERRSGAGAIAMVALP